MKLAAIAAKYSTRRKYLHYALRERGAEWALE